MHIVFLNGSEFKGSWRDFTRALWHPYFVALVLGMLSIIWIFRPYDKFMPSALMIKVVIVITAATVFLASAISMFKFADYKKFTIQTLPVITSSSLLASAWGGGTASMVNGQILQLDEWAVLFTFNIIFCIAAEIFLSYFLLPKIARETGMEAHPIKAYVAPSEKKDSAIKTDAEAQKPVPEKPAQPEWIELLGEKLAVADVLHLKAEEHYVSITLCNGRSLLLRGRLADAIEQLPDAAGMQVHRSHWVACHALAEVFRAREGWRLRLRSGQEVPVARNRTEPVRAWAKGLLGI